jgi:hypothetical protein
MTLTEFLLARIAEDEMCARLVEDGPGEIMRRGLDPLRITMDDDEVRFAYLTIDPARVLAECEAKRQIVKYVGTMGEVNGDGLEILALMCLPYVDHPDCLHEWWQ